MIIICPYPVFLSKKKDYDLSFLEKKLFTLPPVTGLTNLFLMALYIKTGMNLDQNLIFRFDFLIICSNNFEYRKLNFHSYLIKAYHWFFSLSLSAPPPPSFMTLFRCMISWQQNCFVIVHKLKKGKFFVVDASHKHLTWKKRRRKIEKERDKHFWKIR